jgi:hypothetical protein
MQKPFGHLRPAVARFTQSFNGDTAKDKTLEEFLVILLFNQATVCAFA